ncbi:MAG: ROK family transcriptional regulator [Actinobacteria bacterium]|nr:MAG: ROK family transcriptional regulator [Actinomycetota bacterium]
MERSTTAGERPFAGGTPSLLRAINERTVLETIRELGPVSRAEIARSCGLSKPTVSQALAALVRSRLVREAGRSSGGKGRTAQLYELNAHAGWVLGIDVGRDWVRAAVADLNGAIVARRDERSQAKSARTLISQIGDLAHDLAAEAGLRWRQVSHATIGSPGVFQPTRRKMTLAQALPGWGREGVFEALQKALGTHVSIENDVNAATVGEQLHGLGKGVANFVFLHVGTGVGLGLVLNGELFRGSTGAAGEVGHLPFGSNSATPGGGRRGGALEATVGGVGVVAEAKRLGMRGSLNARRVFGAARRGDPLAQRVVALEAKRIAFTIAAIVPVVDPELVVLGGGIGRNGDLLLDPVERELHALSPLRPRVDVSVVGEDAAVLGAVAMALQSAQDRLFARAAGRREIVV